MHTMKNFISSLMLLIGILVLAFGLLFNPITTPVFSQENSVSIVPRAADPNNGLSFDPPQISVPTGTIVSWTNEDSIQHTVTSDQEGLFDAGPITPGDTFENAFDTPGEYSYHCAIHPFMTGTVMVG
jgi:plastocyanin